MTIKLELNELYCRASNGKVKEWKASVEEIDGIPHIVVCRGYHEMKKQTNKKPIRAGKNIGRANETTPLQQAISETKSKWNKKKDELYVEDINMVDSERANILPMLAVEYEKRKHNIKWPCIVQPKLNGVRGIFQHDDFVSRKNKIYNTLDHLRADLEKLKPFIDMPDGEIYYHGMSLQKIGSAVKKINEDTEKLEYWIYDQVLTKNSFRTRRNGLSIAFEECGAEPDEKGMFRLGQLVCVSSILVYNEEEMIKAHKEFVLQGFEGTIIRNTDGVYIPNLHRSKDLQKYKDFYDSEFEIIGGKLATGLEEGCIVFRVKTKDGKEFEVKPRGTREIRREWALDMDNIVGKMLTVRYPALSDSGIPCSGAVGVAIRDYE
jgi:DNA ligase-1